jgi:hypothetical protein
MWTMYSKSFLKILAVVAIMLAGSSAAFALVWEERISIPTDDQEEYADTPGYDISSSDLEMPYESEGRGTPQIVGLRFSDVKVPNGANVTSAYLEFVCDETKGGSDPVSLLIEGELSPNSAAISTAASYNVSSRTRTTANAVWEPENWTAAGQLSQTSDISAVILEIVNQSGWASGNALTIIISDDPANPSTGLRCAEAVDGSAAQAPLLHVEFTSKYASNPSPPNGALYEDAWASLSWDPGETAATHDIYMSDNFDLVNNRDPAAFQGNQAFPFFTVGFPGFAYPDGLASGTTYYWATDEVEADGVTKYGGPVWSFSIPSKAAYDPSPRHGAKAVQTDVTLSWTPGFGAKLHTVYFGDDLDTVTNATGGIPLGATTYTPGELEKGKVYYWRVDELNPPETVKGTVWSFRTLPDIVIADPDMIGWWKLDNVFGTTVLDWSGYGNDGTLGGDPQLVEGAVDMALELDGSDYIAIDGVVDDITSTNITLSIWIKSTQTGQGDLFAANDSASAHPLEFYISGGYPGRYDGGDTNYPGAPFVADGQWHMMTYVREGNRMRIYVDGAEVVSDAAGFDLSTVTRWSIGQEWDGSTPSNFYTGLVDDARFFSKALTAAEVAELMRGDPTVAWNPHPANNQEIDVEVATQPLSWSPGDNASEHDVYLGTDRDAVAMADTSTADIYRGRQAGATYSPPEGLEWGTGPYYWRIDEINADGSVSAGSIWSFAVADYLLIEDFESYDSGENQIWYSWLDGLGFGSPGFEPYSPGNGTGAMVGDETTNSFTEETVVHGGGKSMPMWFDNNKAGFSNYSQTDHEPALSDWTIHGVGALSIWLRGYPASVGSFAEGPVGTFTITASGRDIWDNADQFHFAYKMLTGAGTIIARVDSITNTDPWAKAGVMIRETLDPGSTYAFALVSAASGVASQERVNPNGSATGTTQAGISAPRWVRLERDLGGYFTVSHSNDGSTWEPVQNAVPARILMGSVVYAGLAVTSHNNAATCEAKFSNVSITGQVSPQWSSQDVGIASNDPEPLYVVLSNANGTSGIIIHDDTDAATMDVWSEWVIPLQAFADQGVNLSNIDNMSIGLGTQGNMNIPGGSGKMYFDDIRLYRVAP